MNDDGTLHSTQSISNCQRTGSAIRIIHFLFLISKQLHANCVGVDFCLHYHHNLLMRRIATIFAVRCVPVHVVQVRVKPEIPGQQQRVHSSQNQKQSNYFNFGTFHSLGMYTYELYCQIKNTYYYSTWYLGTVTAKYFITTVQDKS